MEKTNSGLERYRRAIDYWWLRLLAGILIFAVGILVFFRPVETYAALTVLFGVMIFVSGISEIVIGSYAPKGTGRGWVITAGIIEVVLGIILMCSFPFTAAVLPFFLAFWLLFRGMTLIGVASDMTDYGVKGNGWVIAAAILLMLCAFLILVHPVVGAGLIVALLGVSFLIAGMISIILSIRLQQLKKNLGSRLVKLS